MDAIELFYAAYGVLLALAFAKVLSGTARLVSHRKTIRIGWATPLLMLLLLFDLASSITNAWRQLGTADPSLRLVVACLTAAGAYYLAASLVVPEVLVEDADLERRFAATKLFTVGGLLVANLMGAQVVEALIKGPAEVIATRWTGFSAVMNFAFYGLVLALLLIRNRATNIIMLATLNAIFVLVLLVF
jgi:hypothetical protein